MHSNYQCTYLNYKNYFNVILKQTFLGGKKKSRKQKMISVPNACPFKEEILAEAEKCREFIKEEKAKQKLLNKNKKKGAKERVKMGI